MNYEPQWMGQCNESKLQVGLSTDYRQAVAPKKRKNEVKCRKVSSIT